MSTVREDHERAMELADAAFEARRRQNGTEATRLFRESLQLERSAAEQVMPDIGAEPTRSVLLRSAASLALQCEEFRTAEKLIAIALSGNPPDEIVEELRTILAVVYEKMRSRVATAV